MPNPNNKTYNFKGACGRPRKYFDVLEGKKPRNRKHNWSKDSRVIFPVLTPEERKRLYVKSQWDQEDIKKAYIEYFVNGESLRMLAGRYNISVQTLKKYFVLISEQLREKRALDAWMNLSEKERMEFYEHAQEKRLEEQNGKRETEGTVRASKDLHGEEWDRLGSDPKSP